MTDAKPPSAEERATLNRRVDADRELRVRDKVASYPHSEDDLKISWSEAQSMCLQLDAARAESARLERERDEARRFGEEAAARYNALIAKGETLTCAFCGQVYPPGTPPTQHEALTAHVHECPKHPLRAAREQAESRLAVAVEALRELRSRMDVAMGDTDPADENDPDLLAMQAASQVIDDLSAAAEARDRRLLEQGFQEGRDTAANLTGEFSRQLPAELCKIMGVGARKAEMVVAPLGAIEKAIRSLSRPVAAMTEGAAIRSAEVKP